MTPEELQAWLRDSEARARETRERLSYLEGFTRTIAPNHWWELLKMVLLSVALVLAILK